MHSLRQEESYMFLFLSYIVRKIQPGYLKVLSYVSRFCRIRKKLFTLQFIEVYTTYSEE